MGRFDDRVAVVTGGASGIGRAMVLRFLDEGAAVVAADMNQGNGEALSADVAGLGLSERFRFEVVDVSVEDDVAGCVSEAVSAFGRLDVICNNAGIIGAFGPITEIDVEHWDATFAVMVRGVFLGIKHGARAMKKQGDGGVIVNTASVAGLSGGSGPQAYSAAKAAVINLTRAVSIELAPDRIRVNAICPGGILTPLVTFGRDDRDVAAGLESAQPWPDHGRPDHIAAAAAFLASDDAEFVSGEALVVDGGLTAAGPNLSRVFGSEPSMLSSFTGLSNGSTGADTVIRAVDVG